MIYYNGKNLGEFQVKTDEAASFGMGTPDVSAVQIPGRNGDLRYSNGRFSNVTLSYSCFIRDSFKENYQNLLAFLFRDTEYHRLEDTEHEDYYRMAACDTPPDYTTSPWNKSGSFTLQFNCRPEKWLKSGEKETAVSSGSTLYNPTLYDALPLIRVTGSGTLTIGGSTYTCAASMSIDSESQDCYDENGSNLNGSFTMNGADFPVLVPGKNGISFTGFSAVKITPRWWTV